MGRKKGRNNRFNKTKSEVMRCRVHNKPVFNTDNCSSFVQKTNSDKKSNCVNCKNSF